METSTTEDSAAAQKHNPYAEAADSTRYRVADAPLFSCQEHHAACVLCTTAGKNGRNGRTAAVGATLFWLTCPHMNALVARLEGHRAVPAMSDALRRHTALLRWHVQSNYTYTARAKELLTEAQWAFFHSHFVSEEAGELRKYGNAAVSHAADMKCLHALVAQSLAGATNPIGSLVLNFILLLDQLAQVAEETLTNFKGREEERASARLRSRAALDDGRLFSAFVDAFVCTATAGRADVDWAAVDSLMLEVTIPEQDGLSFSSFSYVWRADAALGGLVPDGCARALRVLVFLEGKPPRRHKKHRIN